MNSKVIFLDMDGVVNNSKSSDLICLPMRNVRNEDCGATVWSVSNIKPFLSLMKWCYNNGINIVISSTWRVSMTTNLFDKYLNKYFHRNKLPCVVGLTNVCLSPYMHRGIEIEDYIRDNNVIQYMCIDDETDDILEKISKENVYTVNAHKGLTKKDVDSIKKQWYNIYNK